MKKLLFVTVAGLAVIAGLGYYLSFKSLTLTFNNVSQADIYPAGTNTAHPAASVQRSGQTVRLRGGSYVVHFVGENGYADGSRAVTLSSAHQTLDYAPYYSDDKLAAMLRSELPAIQQVVARQLPASKLYTLQPGRLYHWGEWYGTTLHYKGNDIFNSDMLRLVAHKENNQWVIKTNPPDISLSKLIYSDVPHDVLDSVNTAH